MAAARFLLDTARVPGRFRPFGPPPPGIIPDPIVFNAPVAPTTDEVVATNRFGQPVRGQVIFGAASYTLSGQTLRTPQMTLNEALVTVSRSKRIVETPVDGRASSVKEIYSTGDFEVTIAHVFDSGVFQRYPALQLRLLKDLEQAPIPIRVQGDVFDTWEIYALVIRSVNIAPQTKGRNLIEFTIQAVSDEPLELQLSRGL